MIGWPFGRRSRSVAASRMTVSRHVPWPLRAGGLLLALALGAGGTLLAVRMGSGDAQADRASLADQVSRLQTELVAERGERKRWAAIASATDSQLRIERTTAERLAEQVRVLETDAARLKSDLAYFESLMPAGDGDQPLAIRRFEVEAEGPSGAMRYRALLSQGGRAEKEFSGALQLLVTLVGDGKVTTLTIPDQTGGPELRERMRLSFRRYQRVEGRFDVPAGQAVKSVQLRVLERGTVRAQQVVTP